MGPRETINRGGRILMGWLMIRSIKLPIMGVHSWLPLLHAESSLRGSIFLAGLALKMGGVVILRGTRGIMEITRWEATYAIRGMRVVTLWIIRVRDTKVWVAYSSVVHIICGLIRVRMWEKGRIYLYRTGNILHT